MSVSDPSLKQFKAYILDFRTEDKVVDDYHSKLVPFCETLENILRKGLKPSSSIFGTTRRDYWNWIDCITTNNGKICSPKLSVIADKVKSCKKVTTVVGRGRLYLRFVLQQKAVLSTLDSLLKSDEDVVEQWYDPELSILGNEILSEIFLSLLYQVNEITFDLNFANATFLDSSWDLPIYRKYEFVPCKDLGVQVQFVNGLPIAVDIQEGGVAAEDDKIEIGDVLDELLGEPTRDMKIGKMGKLLRQNQGFPVPSAVIKCHMVDDSIYPPISALLRQVGKDVHSLQELLKQEEKRKRKMQDRTNSKKPAHALLPEDEKDELPVHSDEGAAYRVKYCGKVKIGNHGGVDKIEKAVGEMLRHLDDKTKELQDVIIIMGEKDVTVKDLNGTSCVLSHSYTEISSCGRRTDCVEYFAYIAGETTCTIAKDFVGFVFLARNNEESKTILCSIAQGFNRTHWFV